MLTKMNTNNQNNKLSAKPISMANYLNGASISKFLQEVLADKKSEFISNLIALCDTDKNLAECDPGMLMKCAMNATALNLPLNKNLGYAYVIAYKGIPSFQIGYKGLIQLAIRTGQYKYINATEIREGEIKHNKITGEVIFNGEKPDAKVVGYMAYLELVNGFTASLYMTEEQLEEHAIRFSKMYQYDKSKGSSQSKWSDPLAKPAMCRKTVLKLLLSTYGLMTTEFAKALSSDNEEEAPQGGMRYEDAEIISQTEPQYTSESKKQNNENDSSQQRINV